MLQLITDYKLSTPNKIKAHDQCKLIFFTSFWLHSYILIIIAFMLTYNLQLKDLTEHIESFPPVAICNKIM